MNEDIPLKDLTNEQFYLRLKAKEESKEWTLGEIIEYEKRGSHAFDHDKKLVATLNFIIDEQNKKLAEIMKPYQESLLKLASASVTESTRAWSETFANQSATIRALVPKIDFPKFTLPDAALLKPELLRQPYSQPLVQKVVVENLDSIFEGSDTHLSTIAKNTSWDWKQWLLFSFSLTGAIAGIVAAVAAIITLYLM